MEKLTFEDHQAITCFEEASNELRRARGKQEDAYWTMIKTLGEKANCHLCGNAHWPLCGDE